MEKNTDNFMGTRPLGSIFEVDGIKYEVQRGNGNCKGCIGCNDVNVCVNAGDCASFFRDDGQDIIVKRVE